MTTGGRGFVSRETLLQRHAEAMAYAGWGPAKFMRQKRFYGRKVDLVEFILAWRDGESCAAIADRFNLSDEDYPSELRRKLGLPSRGWGGPRAKGTAVTREFLAAFAIAQPVDACAECRKGIDLSGADQMPGGRPACAGARGAPPPDAQRPAAGSAARISRDGEAP